MSTEEKKDSSKINESLESGHKHSQDALSNLTKALDIYKKSGDDASVAHTYLELAKVHASIANIHFTTASYLIKPDGGPSDPPPFSNLGHSLFSEPGPSDPHPE